MATKSRETAKGREAVIKEPRQAKESPRAGAERLWVLLEATSAVPWEADARTWQFTYVGPQAVKLLGYPLDRWFEDDFWPTHIHPEDRDRAVEFCLKASRSRKDYEFEYRMIAADGRIVWLHDIVNVVSANGKPVTLRGFLIDITERKDTEAALCESEERFRTVANSTTDLIWEWDAEADTVKWFGDIDGVLGYEPGEVPRTFEGWEASLHPDDRDRIIQAFERCLEQGGNFLEEYRVKRKDGTYRYWVDRAAAISFDGAKPRKWVGACTDITERKQAEEAVVQSEKQLRLLIDSLPVFISYIDREERYRLDNKAYEKWFGSSVTGKHIKDVLGDTLYEATRPYVEKALSGQTVTYDCRFPSREDGSRDVVVTFVPDFDVTGEAKGFFALTTDVTETKQREEALENALSEVARLKSQLEAENIYLKEEIKLEHNFDEIIGESPALKEVLLKVEQVAATDSTVLILGETGTGKELLARAIHNLSPRRDRPLVKVDCAALPPALIETELFGHEKGAFTGAHASRIGRFELANGGTILLDEIGDLPLDLQTKLLRVLQEGQFERLGSPRTKQVDVRIIAASNRDLAAGVRDGSFRADLYYRLNVFPLYLPPLGERKEDIPLLVRSFVGEFARRHGRTIDAIPQQAIDAFQAYSWPGNIRELRNVIERAVIAAQGSTLQLPDSFEVAQTPELETPRRGTLEDFERDYIKQALNNADWRIEGEGGAAMILGLNPGTLRSRLRKLGISRPNGD